MTMLRAATWVVLWGLLVLSGCAGGPTNPSLPVSVPQAEVALREMKQSPKALARPVVVVGGFMDVGVAAPPVAEQLRRATGDGRVISVSVGLCPTFNACRERVIAAVDEAFPSTDPLWTTEVDVVGYSMGGIVARYAGSGIAEAGSGAVPTSARAVRRLRIGRLFTISSPHRGAMLAKALPVLNSLQADMRAESPFMVVLNAQPIAYPLYPYVCLGDEQVGDANAAPAGVTAWWVSNESLSDAHGAARKDPRILADIARRLRYETPFATQPPAPLPGK
jgi:pimeloyl-ACP methyl ester carboxylesterase